MDMPSDWSQLTPQQKRERRIQNFLEPYDIKFASPEAEKDYKTRARRLIDVYNVREPDRVPVNIMIGTPLPAYLNGIDYYTAIHDYDKAVEAWNKFNREYAAKLESFASPMQIPAKVFAILDYKLYTWPGHGQDKSATCFQFIEGEYMRADEYDALIQDPSDFWLRTYLPRVFGIFEPFTELPPLTDIVEVPTASLMPLATPSVQSALQAMLDAGKELSTMLSVVAKHESRGLELGFPVTRGAFCKAPFDTLGDTLRGTKGIISDMYRQPEKLIKAMDVIADLLIKSALAQVNRSMGLVAMFPLHKGADGWMSRKQFETFYWPYLKKVMNALINEGVIVSLFAEGSYNTRLESVNEFPKGSVHWLFDQTDMARAKKILGGNCSISGNVPSSLMITGTPQEVKEYCRNLIETCGKGGGFMLAPGAVTSVETKLENMLAMVEAAKEYGVYLR